MPVRHARSETRGRPPFGRRGEVGKNSSIRSHNRSGSSATAMPVHATSPTGIKSRRFCYRLLVPSNDIHHPEIAEILFPREKEISPVSSHATHSSATAAEDGHLALTGSVD
jgi:hypothetical protein